jgi:hypothetical protein
MGIPETKLAEHFWISVVFRGTGGNCNFTLNIPDHATYANGAIDIAQFALSCRDALDAGFYDTQRILELSGELAKDATRGLHLV